MRTASCRIRLAYTWRPAALPAAAWSAASQIHQRMSASLPQRWRPTPRGPPSKLPPHRVAATRLRSDVAGPAAPPPHQAPARQACRPRCRRPRAAAAGGTVQMLQVWKLAGSRACLRPTSCWQRPPPLEPMRQSLAGGCSPRSVVRILDKQVFCANRLAARVLLSSVPGCALSMPLAMQPMQAVPACLLHRQCPACEAPQIHAGHVPSLSIPRGRPQACWWRRKQQPAERCSASHWRPPCY